MPDFGFSLADVGQGLLIVILALLGAIGVQRGRNAKPKEIGTLAGGIVDNTALNELSAAIRERNSQDRENRKLTHEFIEAIGDLRKELTEVRHEIRMKR